MIVTLAGHVDHGKTALVRALSGVDTDRLAEEKARGLTIDLGFAYADMDGFRIGFVDVPGHQRFVHNMIAGVGNHQHALMVVAADDGVMPQTVEHLQILCLLGLTAGTIALTKVDRVDSDRIQQVRTQIRALTSRSFLQNARMVEVAATTGKGIPALARCLVQAARARRVRDRSACFRLAIDRAFTLPGAGTIVTGTVLDGAVAVQDQLVVSGSSKPVRVRSIAVQGEPADSAMAGDRAGINIAGIAAGQVCRGQWLMDPNAMRGVRAATLDLELLAEHPRAVGAWHPVHMYHLTAHSLGRIASVGADPVRPGTTGLVDANLHEPLQLKAGDAVIFRSHDQSSTIGGGTVISIDLLPRRRKAPARVSQLKQASRAARAYDPAGALVAATTNEPVDASEFCKAWNIPQEEFVPLANGCDVIVDSGSALRRDRVCEVLERIVKFLRLVSAKQSGAGGCSVEALSEQLHLSSKTVKFVVGQGVGRGLLVYDSGCCTLAGEAPKPVPFDEPLFERVRECVERPVPLAIGDIAKELRIRGSVLSHKLKEMVRAQALVRLSANRLMTPDRLREMTAIVVDLGAKGPFTVAEVRDATGLGRNASIELLEYMDRSRMTRRSGNARTLVDSDRKDQIRLP